MPVRPWATSTQRFAVRVIEDVMCADAASCNTQLRASSHQRMWGSVFVREPSKGTGRADGTVRLPCDRTVVGQGEDGCPQEDGGLPVSCGPVRMHMQLLMLSAHKVIGFSGAAGQEGCSGLLLILRDNECGGRGSHGNGDACPSPVLPQVHERLLHLSSGLSGTGPRNL